MHLSVTRWNHSLALFTALILVPGCGVCLSQQPTINPPKNTLPTSKIQGIGINTHGQILPKEDLKAIGISWVRVDLPGDGYSRTKIKELVDYYRDFGQLWILVQTDHDQTGTARRMVDAGITEIEVFNEPDLIPLSPTNYAKAFKSVRAAVVGRARLYGPSIGTLDSRYLDDCIRAGVEPDVVSIHGYRQKSFPTLRNWVLGRKTYGVPVVVTEVGFPRYLGAMRYRVDMADSIGDLFAKTKSALQGVPWCWYDGPNPGGNDDCGLFDWNPKKGYVPNANYRQVRTALEHTDH